MTRRDTTAGFDFAALRAQARRLAELARAEDLGRGDVTSMLLPAGEGPGLFRIQARQPGVFAGREIAPTVLEVYGGSIQLHWLDAGFDGAAWADPPVDIAELAGPAADILTAERVLLNFLQRLCGIATLTRRYVDAVAGTAAAILDTRKTTPGWRVLEKYAVRCGGGENHRFGLHDAVLIKDNHLAPLSGERIAGAVFDMLNRVEKLDPPPKFVEVEADGLAQAEQLLSVVGIDVIMLDNFSPEDLRRAVTRRDALNLKGKVKLEASGGITLETVRAVAATGVDRISVGALTHSAPALDLSLERIA